MEFEYIRTIEVSRLIQREGVYHKLESGLELAIFLIGEAVYAVDNKCPHMGMPLHEGAIDGDQTLVCRYHQWKFDLKTGTSTFAPNIYVKKYEAKVEDGFVFVKMPRPV
jgi:nitrite reductase/ring-hydroxylating ferredoxin subunit